MFPRAMKMPFRPALPVHNAAFLACNPIVTDCVDGEATAFYL
jgi:hypothetical protein